MKILLAVAAIAAWLCGVIFLSSYPVVYYVAIAAVPLISIALYCYRNRLEITKNQAETYKYILIPLYALFVYAACIIKTDAAFWVLSASVLLNIVFVNLLNDNPFINKKMSCLIIFTGLSILNSCKKSEPATNMTVSITQLSSITLLTMKIVNQNGVLLLNLKNSNSNQSYNLSPVNKGDILTVTYNSNIVNQLADNGVANVEFVYEESEFAGFGGSIQEQPGGYTYSVTVP